MRLAWNHKWVLALFAQRRIISFSNFYFYHYIEKRICTIIFFFACKIFFSLLTVNRFFFSFFSSYTTRRTQNLTPLHRTIIQKKSIAKFEQNLLKFFWKFEKNFMNSNFEMFLANYSKVVNFLCIGKFIEFTLTKNSWKIYTIWMNLSIYWQICQ